MNLFLKSFFTIACFLIHNLRKLSIYDTYQFFRLLAELEPVFKSGISDPMLIQTQGHAEAAASASWDELREVYPFIS